MATYIIDIVSGIAYIFNSIISVSFQTGKGDIFILLSFKPIFLFKLAIFSLLLLSTAFSIFVYWHCIKKPVNQYYYSDIASSTNYLLGFLPFRSTAPI